MWCNLPGGTDTQANIVTYMVKYNFFVKFLFANKRLQLDKYSFLHVFTFLCIISVSKAFCWGKILCNISNCSTRTGQGLNCWQEVCIILDLAQNFESSTKPEFILTGQPRLNFTLAFLHKHLYENSGDHENHLSVLRLNIHVYSKFFSFSLCWGKNSWCRSRNLVVNLQLGQLVEPKLYNLKKQKTKKFKGPTLYLYIFF